jgi:hypothetical protein
MNAETLDLALGLLSLVLSLFIFSYLLGDNFLYRLSLHVLIGATAGYLALVAIEGVIIPWVNLTILNTGEGGEGGSLGLRAFGLIPFLLATFLLLKQLPNSARFGNLGLAFLIGVGTGVSIVGAVVGTIVPLSNETGASLEQYSTFNGLVLVVGTISTLVYFQYLARRGTDGQATRSRPMLLLAGLGKGFIAVTLGALYAGLVLTSLAILSGLIEQHLSFLLEQLG